MASWTRVRERIVARLTERSEPGRRIPESEIFHELVQLAEQVLGTDGPPVPFDAPFYEAPRTLTPNDLIREMRRSLDTFTKLEAILREKYPDVTKGDHAAAADD